MISIALGAALVLTAAAAVRAVAQALTASRRLAITNDLVRAGVRAALAEADFWQGEDDPEDPARQPLRGRDAATGAGMPFTPFRDARDPITGGPFVDTRPGFDEIPDSPRGGWNARPLAWAAHDPRTWTRAGLVEENDPPQWWGTTGIYGNLDPSASWHHWYDGQVRGLIDALGFYGMYDYLPSNGYVVWHGSEPAMAWGGIAWNGVPNAIIGNGVWLAPPDGWDNNMKGRARNSNGSRYFVPGPAAATPATCRRIAYAGYEGRQTGFNDAVLRAFLADSAVPLATTSLQPTHWPLVKAEVRRFIEHGHTVIACQVSCADPVSGSSFSVPFTCVGTSLRGARGQRRPDRGWADPYHGPTLDVGAAP